ncbi:MAG: heavy-metal-associated domain-containing protein [Flavobacteriales bacterium]|nr:heavy-metal-associated domain-containing protein [Flavobacteriales bacterium]
MERNTGVTSVGIVVDNLKCGGCAATIRRRLNAIAGVRAVQVDESGGTIRVDHDGTVSRERITDALHALGYPEHGTGDLLDAAKSYVSCAIGRARG